MKAMRNINFGLILLLIFITHPYSQTVKSGQTGLQFLEIGVSARAEGMGGAYTLSGRGAESAFYNLAGMAYINTTYDFTASHVKWFADIAYTSVSAAFKPFEGNFGIIGISLQTVDYGDFEGTMVSNTNKDGFVDTGTFSPKALSVGIGYAKPLTDRFSIGGQVKYVEQSLGSNIIEVNGTSRENKVSGFAFDFGTIYHTGIKSLDFGMQVRNFAADFKYEKHKFEAPLSFRLGFAMNLLDLFPGDYKTSSLLMAVDAVHPRDDTEHIEIGAEYQVFEIAFIRSGYKVNYDIKSFTAGFGLNLDIQGMNLKIDYSYGTLKYFDNVQRFTLGLSI